MEDKELEKGTLEEEVKETDLPEDAETEETAAEEAAAEETEEAENGKEEKKEKKGFFKKKEDPRDAQIEELNDKLRRSMAEFDNFRKRTEKEKSAMYEVGAKSVIEKILPIVDNFERGLAAVPEDAKGTPLEEGMEKIYKQLLKTLEEMDVKPIEAVGKEFNPDFHNAVMHVEDEEVEESTVVEEFQKGYIYKEHVIRYSMVKVAN